ncbi:MAG: solute carrier family 12 sodium/potassium/chloride transporter 2 [Bacteroidia bacterium]|jgi:solute carrier family 12 sodium/potassium/chloride transporter 2
MSELLHSKGKFGTAPVFLTAISTILGAVMFLRFGFAVASVGFLGTLSIIVLGHLVTIPTAMSLAEIATNQKVEGGGEYYIISRSFGLTIGASIGLALYLSQAISVAFYVIAFSEAFGPVLSLLQERTGLDIAISKRILGLVSVVLLGILMYTKGAKNGMWMLYVVVAILAVSLIMFFAGTGEHVETFLWQADKTDFFVVFAIVFPAFTGMTAGVGLSGDLKDPKKSIPQGTLFATVIGMLIYVLIAYKLAGSATPEHLLGDQLVMSKIAVWGPIIPIGLAAATISSALGSVMVAPRTLNAIAADKIIPIPRFNRIFGTIKKENGEPVNASLLTCGIAFFFVLLGDINAVAEVISMFFMVTYGAICLISLFENFASNPGYRPSFKSKWYISLIGASLCIILMFKINTIYAILAISLMVLTYYVLSQSRSKNDMSSIFSGVIFQISRNLHVFLQKTKQEENMDEWRPSVVAISKDSFSRHDEFDLLRWISHRKGFGMYIHHIDGYLSKETAEESKECLKRLIKLTQVSDSSVFVDTIINPSYKASITQTLQLPGVSGKENNMMLFEYYKTQQDALEEILDNFGLVKAVGYDTCILCSSQKKFGFTNEIHIWITSSDYQNANLMIYLAYIILGHPDWKNGIIKLFAIHPVAEIAAERIKLKEMIKTGRLPISANNIRIIPIMEDVTTKGVINQNSKDADLTIVGFRSELIKKTGKDFFMGYDNIGNVLFVNSQNEKEIS